MPEPTEPTPGKEVYSYQDVLRDAVERSLTNFSYKKDELSESKRYIIAGVFMGIRRILKQKMGIEVNDSDMALINIENLDPESGEITVSYMPSTEETELQKFTYTTHLHLID
jgi:hypothetical protein